MIIRTITDLAAPPDRVWATLVDFAGHDRWNPLLKHVRGKCEPGAIVHFTLHVGPAPARASAEILGVEPARELRWIGPAMHLARRAFHGTHYFRLTAHGTGTRFEHGEEFGGAMIPARWQRAERWLEQRYAALNHALDRETR
jgi:hypothetical protein